MATAGDIVNGAAKRIGILAPGESLSSEDAVDILATFNDMLHGLELQGVGLGHTTLALTGTVNLPASHTEGLKAMLAVRIAPLFEREAAASTQALAADAESLLRVYYADGMVMDLDSALVDMPSQHMGRWR